MRALLWIFLTALVLLIFAWALKSNFRKWIFPNTIWVRTYQEARSDKVKIDWTAEGLQDTLNIYNKGEVVEKGFYAIGYNTFLLYYDDELVGTFDQFKSTLGVGNKYDFIVWKKQNSVIVDLKIDGLDAPL